MISTAYQGRHPGANAELQTYGLRFRKNSATDEEPVLKQLRDVVSDSELEEKSEKRPDDDEDRQDDDPEDVVMDKIFSHHVNKSGNHHYAAQGDRLYRVRWNG